MLQQIPCIFIGPLQLTRSHVGTIACTVSSQGKEIVEFGVKEVLHAFAHARPAGHRIVPITTVDFCLLRNGT